MYQHPDVVHHLVEDRQRRIRDGVQDARDAKVARRARRRAR